MVEDRSATLAPICIASKLNRHRVETFIRTHIERLPFDVRVLSGVPAIEDERDGSILKKSWRQFFVDWLKRSTPDERVVACQAEFLRRSGVRLVLAEYGLVGAEMTEPCRQAGVPLVVHFHGNDAHNERVHTEWRDGYRSMFKMAAAFVAVSSDMRRHLIELGVPAERVHLIPYWVDPTRFCDAKPADAPPTLLTVGRFVEKKAPHLTLLAFERALREAPDARLVMIGNGPLLGPCQQLAKVLGLSDRVEFLGGVESSVVADWMRRVRGFAQHSVVASDLDSEGTPVAILEASASGLPVIATRHTGIKEAVCDQVSGYLVDELDVNGMAAGMVRVLRDPALAKSLGDAGRRHVAENYSRAQTLDRLAELLRNVLSA